MVRGKQLMTSRVRSIRMSGQWVCRLSLAGLLLLAGAGNLQAQQAPITSAEQQTQADLSQLFYNMQLLQQEVKELRGIVEEQQELVKQLKSQSLERYIDVDRRLGEIAKNAAAGNVAGSSVAASSSVSATGGNKPADDSIEVSKTPAQQEVEMYRAAYNLVRERKFGEAITAFDDFLVRYPSDKYTGNAYYWLGELHLASKPPNLAGSRTAFSKLIAQYPNHRKVPDSLYKLGKVFYLQGEKEKARNLLNRVIDEYASSNSSAPKMARQFMKQNF